MIKNTSKCLTVTALAVAATLLTSCGESDLTDQHNAELDAARAALNDEPDIGAAELAEYTLVFADEFTGSEVDARKWNTALPWGPDFIINDEKQYYVDTQSDPDFGYDPFVLNGVTLGINAIPTPEGYEDRASNQAWLSGVLSSHEKFSFTHGYVEARVNVPVGQGLQSAFWMLSSEFNERKPQVFMMEYDGAKPESVFTNYNFENDDGELSTFGRKDYSVPGFQNGFNTIGLEWSPEALRYYVNGQLRRTIEQDLPEQDMYLILNLAVGGTFADDPDETTPAEPDYQIDYVRVYQRP